MSVMTDTRGLTKMFSSLVAVDHVDMNVKRIEIFGSLGLAVTVAFALVDIFLIRAWPLSASDVKAF